MDKKIANLQQQVSVFEVVLQSGEGSGKRFLIARNKRLEVWFSIDNAMDIIKISYGGYNASFLSKNGINRGKPTFAQSFEGGFLYTCGLDNVNACREGYPIHGSLHATPCEGWTFACDEEKAVIKATVKDTALFRQNITLTRVYTVTEKSVEWQDEAQNDGYTPTAFCLLYHINWGYPMLDSCTKVTAPVLSTEGVNAFAEADKANCWTMTEPQDGLPERCYYHTLKRGMVEIANEKLGITATLSYDEKALPYLVEWKSMGSGDYALGTEPSTTRFDKFQMTELAAGEKKRLGAKITFACAEEK